MTASLLTKSRSHAPVTLVAAALVLQPPRHLTIAPLLLLPGHYHVGSDPACDLVLDAAGIAPQHLVLIVGPHGIALRALDSRTWVNEFLVTATSLRKGDRISVGPLTVTLRAATPDDVLTHVPAAMESEPVVVASPSTPQDFASVDATLEQVQADLAAVQAVEIATPEVIFTPESSNESAMVTPEMAVVQTPLPVVELVVAETPAMDDLAERIAAWENERVEQERLLADRRHVLATRAASLDEREAEVTAWKNTRADQERHLAERRHDLATRAVGLDEREARLTAWESERVDQEQHLAGKAHDLVTRAAGLDEHEALVIARECAIVEQERNLVEKVSELAGRAAGLEERETRLTAFESRLNKREEALDQRQTEFDAQRTAIDYREATLTEERLRLETITNQVRAELAAETEKQAVAWEEWETAQRKLAATLNEQFAEIRDAETRLAAEKAALDAQQQANDLDRQVWETERAEWDARRRQQQLELAQWEAESYQQRNDLSQQSAQLETQRAELHAEVCQRATAHRELVEARQETQRERRLFAEQQAAWMAERDTQWNEFRERRRQIDADEREIANLQVAAREALTQLESDRATLAAAPPPLTLEVPPPDEAALVVAPNERDHVEQDQPEDFISKQVMAVSRVADEALIEAASTEVNTTPTWLMEPAPVADADFTFTHLQERFHEQAIERVEELSVLPPLGWAQAWHPPAGFSAAPELVTESPTPLDGAFFESGSLAESLTFALRPPLESHDIIEDAAPHEIIAESTPLEVPADDLTEETAADEELHVRLARMFGLPEDFGHHDAAPETPNSSEGIVAEESPESVAIESNSIEEDLTTGTTGGDADEVWRANLALMLATPTVEAVATNSLPIEPPPAATKSVASPLPAATTEEDSIAAYMERLLVRNKMGAGSTDTASESKPAPTSVVEPTRTIELPVRAQEAPGDFAEDARLSSTHAVVPTLENKTRVDKDEVRAALQSFREVANLSARTALAEHSSKTLRGELVVQGILTGLASVAALGYWCGPLFGASVQPLHGTGCLIAAGVMGWQISRSLNQLKNWNPDDVLLNENIGEDVASITDLLAQADAAINEVAPNDLQASVVERAELPASDDQTPSLQEPTHTEPMGGMIGPGGDLGTGDGPQSIAVPSIPVDVQFGGDAVLLQSSIEEDGTHR